MSSGPESATVESPFIDQVIVWKLVTCNLDQPSVAGRETLRALLIKSGVRKAIERINLSDVQPWLDEGRISQAISAPEVAEVQKPHIMRCGVVEKFLSRRVRVPPLLTESAA